MEWSGLTLANCVLCWVAPHLACPNGLAMHITQQYKLFLFSQRNGVLIKVYEEYETLKFDSLIARVKFIGVVNWDVCCWEIEVSHPNYG